MAYKPNFTPKKKRKVHGSAFWDKEYTDPTHLKLSTNESEDLVKFCRWLIRRKRDDILQPGESAIDVGCGNGRNLIFLAEQFDLKGFGVDVSSAAIAQAKEASKPYLIEYLVQSAGLPLPTENNSCSIALDMMSSHFLSKEDRLSLRDELFRTLKPGGYLFMKTFLKDEDLHTSRLLSLYPAPEPGAYIHPVMGVAEYVYSEEELVAFLGERFLIRKVARSHRHRTKGGAGKRRTISVYAEKDY